MKFKELKKIRPCKNAVDFNLGSVISQLERYENDYGLDYDPDFQREHVWFFEHQVAYVEHILRGGTTYPIIFNSPLWGDESQGNRDLPNTLVVVDGKQRLTAILKFLNNELPVFDGNYLRDFDDASLMLKRIGVQFSFNGIQTRLELLDWYLELNSTRVAHTDAELNRVQELRMQEQIRLSKVDDIQPSPSSP